MLDHQKKRYSRHLALNKIGEQGQEQLLDASVLVVGAGGLGSAVILYLAAAGVGQIGVVDSDHVELSNLQRQIIHREKTLGKLKTDSAKQSVSELNSDVKVETYPFRLNANNAHEIIKNYDIVADCSDNFTTRFLINDICHDLKKPLVTGAVIEFSGYVATFKSYEDNNPCFRCFCPEEPEPENTPDCSSNGVLGAVVGVIGSLQAAEIIKEMIFSDVEFSTRLIRYDLSKGSATIVGIVADNQCVKCS